MKLKDEPQKKSEKPNGNQIKKKTTAYRNLAGEGLDLPEVGVGDKVSLRKLVLIKRPEKTKNKQKLLLVAFS